VAAEASSVSCPCFDCAVGATSDAPYVPDDLPADYAEGQGPHGLGPVVDVPRADLKHLLFENRRTKATLPS